MLLGRELRKHLESNWGNQNRYFFCLLQMFIVFKKDSRTYTAFLVGKAIRENVQLSLVNFYQSLSDILCFLNQSSANMNMNLLPLLPSLPHAGENPVNTCPCNAKPVSQWLVSNSLTSTIQRHWMASIISLPS